MNNINENERFEKTLYNTYVRNHFRKQYYNENNKEPSEEQLDDYIIFFIKNQNNYNTVKTEKTSNNKFYFIYLFFLIALVLILFSLSIINSVMATALIFILIFIFIFIFIFGIKYACYAIFPMVLVLIIGPFIFNFLKTNSNSINYDKILNFLGGVLSLCVGILSALIPTFNNMKLRKRCTSLVNAKVVEISLNHKPVYQYRLKYAKCKVTGNRDRNAIVGTETELWINPSRPNEAYFKNDFFDDIYIYVFSFPFIFLGVVFICVSLNIFNL